MAATTIMAMLKPKLTPSSTLPLPGTAAAASRPVLPSIKPMISLLSLQSLPKTLTAKSLTSTAIAGAVFSALSSADAAFAAQQIADIAADGDNRGLALLLPIVPAILWVLYNILQPALNQLNRMRSEKGFVVGLGLGTGLTAAGLMLGPHAEAAEILRIAEAAAPEGDNRGLLLLFVVAPAIAWVLFNILQPALNQLNRMRSG